MSKNKSIGSGFKILNTVLNTVYVCDSGLLLFSMFILQTWVQRTSSLNLSMKRHHFLLNSQNAGKLKSHTQSQLQFSTEKQHTVMLNLQKMSEKT